MAREQGTAAKERGAGQQEADPEVVKTLGLGKPRRRRWIWRAVMVLGAVLVVALGVRWFKQRQAAAGIPKYEDAEVTTGDLAVTVTATGTLEGLNTVDVGAEVSGRITKVHVDFNDRVEKGQLLAEVDPEQLQASADEASARVASAGASLQQMKATLEEANAKLVQAEAQAAEGLISKQDMITTRAAAARAAATLAGAKADATLAQAQLKNARTKLDRTRIVAPIKGIVLSRLVEAGQTVTAGFETPVMFKLAEDLTRMRLHVYVDEADVGRVREGQEASFTVDAYAGKTFPSKLLSLRNEPKSEEGVVSYEAVLSVDNTELLLRPGMTATATITTEARKGVMLVPNAALRFSPPVQGGPGGPPAGPAPGAEGVEGARVWILENGKPIAKPVAVGATDGTRSEITSEIIKPGMRVLTDLAETP
ncbi:efflux RND transporter periplasmic adaptor subunit [Chondromyces apiculatus]|uniref:Macrolide-specific efflux protein MacA n=1 Tax=Chondromyces apiculatus DSM 436 TaxID=1192034 RepID=A0A017TGW9_9BACT|nr:efflux RND transporter periplasmic adaptor subunit [Chondromyces apiculatus]EYF08494.1 Macrolide-specific efflux protein MacA [Chondromyces apiculatus DSM 436]